MTLESLARIGDPDPGPPAKPVREAGNLNRQREATSRRSCIAPGCATVHSYADGVREAPAPARHAVLARTRKDGPGAEKVFAGVGRSWEVEGLRFGPLTALLPPWARIPPGTNLRQKRTRPQQPPRRSTRGFATADEGDQPIRRLTRPTAPRLWTPPMMQAFVGWVWCMWSGAVVYPAS